jgi:hypothetical protein
MVKPHRYETLGESNLGYLKRRGDTGNVVASLRSDDARRLTANDLLAGDGEA